MPPSSDSDKIGLAILKAALNGGPMPESLPEEDHAVWQKIIADLESMRKFVRALSAGDLSEELHVRGQIAGSLKGLQSNLRHLTWQVKQIAAGDLNQRVDFLGEFSTAFNQMTENLQRALTSEREQRGLAEAFRDTAIGLNHTTDLDEVYDVLLENLGRILPYHTALFLRICPEQILELIRFACPPGETLLLPDILEGLPRPLGEVPLLHSMTEILQPIRLDTPQGSLLCAPVEIGGQTDEFICLVQPQPGFYKEDDAVRLVFFASQAATAIEKARLIEKLNELATTDALTGIANRRSFAEDAEREFERARTYYNPTVALMLDIDHFKKVNDTYGHAVGDRVLQRVARLCRDSLRKIDLFGRFGGEEFAVLMPETTVQNGLAAAERLRQKVSELVFEADGRKFKVTISIGLAAWTDADTSLDNLLERADQALYAAKQGGRNRVFSQEKP